MSLKYILCVLSAFACITAKAELDLITDDELVNLIRAEKYVVVLFSHKFCEECDKYENELTALREDIVDNLSAWVVKAVDSSMTRLYTPEKEPVIVFFRHGVPLLYDGPLNDELILHTFRNNIEPVVKELTDDTFEHLTQAATGATTGDWFIQFYTTDCVDCQRLQARWEAVGAQLKSRLNVARVNRATTGAKTARRFNVFEVPTFILFRQGKMYKYHNQDFSVKSLVAFAQDWFRNMKAEPVPVPKSPFDDLIAITVDFMKENPYLWQVASGSFVVGLLVSVIMKFFKKSAKVETKPSATGGEKKKKPVKKE